MTQKNKKSSVGRYNMLQRQMFIVISFVSLTDKLDIPVTYGQIIGEISQNKGSYKIPKLNAIKHTIQPL